MRPRTCRRCGCTDKRACPDGCCWTHVRDVCSECLTTDEWIGSDLLLMRPTRTRWTYLVEFARYCAETGARSTLAAARKFTPCTQTELDQALALATDQITHRRAELLARVLPC